MLAKKINYTFQQPDLLSMALTHRSFNSQHNERLEFLGDAVLNFVIAHALYQRYPHAPEGELSRMRANLVNELVLAEIAQRLALGEYLHLGRGELKTGGRLRQSILADTVEAIIGAVYQDGGIAPAKLLIQEWFANHLQQATHIQKRKDAKSRLQEYVQARGLGLPTYQVLYTLGAPHEQTFHVTCQIADKTETTEGCGASRRLAEHEAAEKMLELLKIRN